MNDVQKEEKTEGPEKSWYEEHWFKRKSINQQRETFHNIDRLNKMLLSLSGTLKAPQLKNLNPVKALARQFQLMSASVTCVLECNLMALVCTANNQKLDQILNRGEDTNFSGLPATRNKFEMLMDSMILKCAFTDKMETSNELIKLIMPDIKLLQKVDLQRLLPMVYDFSSPVALNRVIEHLSKQASLEDRTSCPDWDLRQPGGFLNFLLVQNLDIVNTNESDFATQKLRILTDQLFVEAIEKIAATNESDYQLNGPLKGLRTFVTKYHCLKLITILECEETFQQKSQILKMIELLGTLKVCQETEKLMYMTFLTFIMKLELMEDKQIFESMERVFKSKSEIFMSEIIMLKGKQINDLMDMTKCTVDQKDDNLDLGQAHAQMMQSQLVQGGLPLNFFALFDAKNLDEMRNDACKGIGNDQVVSMIDKAKEQQAKAEGSIEYQQNEKTLLEVIHDGRNEIVDLVTEALQQALKKKGGQIALSANTGQKDGLKLTRAAFAVMIKQQGLLEQLHDLIAEADAIKSFGLPAEQGAERNEALVTLINDFFKGEEMLGCWTNATRMRRWLIQKKQSLSEKHENKDDKQALEETQLKEIIEKVVKKAEFITLLQTPNTTFKAEKDELVPALNRRGSLMKQASGATEEVFDLKKTMKQLNNQRAKEIGEASTTSVLAYLQTPIQVYHIKNQILQSSHRAIRRLSALQIIQNLMQQCIEGERVGALKILTSFVNLYQGDSAELLHYTDGLKGCGAFFEDQLRQVFQSILQMVSEQIVKIDDTELAQSMLLAFNCKFKAKDFQFLCDTIQIFPLLFRGGSKTQKQSPLISKSLSFYHEKSAQKDLCVKLQDTIKELLMAIIGRISQGDSINPSKLNQPAPQLSRSISLLDTNWSEQIVSDALREIFAVFQKLLDEHALIDSKQTQLVQASNQFKKSLDDKKMLASLYKILYGQESDDVAQDESAKKATDSNEEKSDKDPHEDDPEFKKAKQNSHESDDNGEGDDGEGDESDSKKKKEDKKDEKQDSKRNPKQVMQFIHQLYDSKISELFLDNYISMIYILSNVAHIDGLLKSTLLKIVNPKHLSILFKLFAVTEGSSKFNMLKLVENLVKLDLPGELFGQALSQEESVQSKLALNIDGNKMASYFLDQAVRAHSNEQGQNQDNIFDVSKQMVHFVTKTIATPDQIKNCVEKSIADLPELKSGDRFVLFQMLGGALETFCLEDQISYHRRFQQSKLASKDDVMVIKKDEKDIEAHKLRVFSSMHGKIITVRKSEVQIVNPISFDVSDECIEKLISSLESSSIDWLTKVCILKYFMNKQVPLSEPIQQKLVNILVALKLELQQVEEKMLKKLDSDKDLSGEKLSIIVLEEHLMKTYIDMLEKGTTDSDKEEKVKPAEVDDDDKDDEKSVDEDQDYQPVNLDLNKINLNPQTADEETLQKETAVESWDKAEEEEKKSSKSAKSDHQDDQSKVEVSDSKPIKQVLTKNYFKKSQQCLKLYDMTDYVFMNKYQNIHQEMCAKTIIVDADKVFSALKLSLALIEKENLPQWSKLISYLANQENKTKTELHKTVYSFVMRCNMRRMLTLYGADCLTSEKEETKKKLEQKGKEVDSDDQLNEWADKLVDKKVKEVYMTLDRARVDNYNVRDEGEHYYDADGYGEGEGEDQRRGGGGEDDSSDNERCEKKIHVSIWDENQIISKLKFLKSKQPIKNKSLTQEYYSDGVYKTVLSSAEDEKAELQDFNALKVLGLRLIELLLYKNQQGSSQEIFKTYVQNKLIKITNSGFASWSQTSKGIDQRVLQDHLNTKVANFEELMGMECVLDIFKSIDKKLFVDTSLQLTNFELIAKIDLLRQISVLLTSQSSDVLLQFAATTIDGLFKAIWWLTNQSKLAGNKSEKSLLLLRVRKALGCLLNLTQKVCEQPKQMVESGVWIEVYKSRGRKELEKLLPEEFENIRNLYQVLLADIFYAIYCAQEQAMNLDDLDKQARSQIQEQIITFEKLCLTMRYTKECLEDTYLTGAVKRNVKMVSAEQKDCELSDLCKDSNGWYKIHLGHGKSTVKIQLADTGQAYSATAAICSEPRITNTTTYHEMQGKNKIELIDTELKDVYLKYPIIKPVYMRISMELSKVIPKCLQLQKQEDAAQKSEVITVQTTADEIDSHFSVIRQGDQASLSLINLRTISQESLNQKTLSFQLKNSIIKSVGVKIKFNILKCVQEALGSTSGHVCVTKCGHIRYLSDELDQFPKVVTKQLHSEIPQGSVAQIASSDDYFYVLTKMGDIFEMKYTMRQKKGHNEVRKMTKSNLRDGSKIVRFTRVEMTKVPRNVQDLPDEKRPMSVFAEALTSNNETVIVSLGQEGSIGRECSEACPASEFHLLDVRYKFPYWTVNQNFALVSAIDESGEIWVLYAQGNHPGVEQDPNKMFKPIKTSLMADKNMRAIRLRSGRKVLLVEAKSKLDQKKKLLVFEVEEKYKGEREYLEDKIETHYHQFSEKCDLLDFFESKSCQKSENDIDIILHLKEKETAKPRNLTVKTIKQKLVQAEHKLPALTDHLKAKHEMLLQRLTRCMNAQFTKKPNEVFQFITDQRGNPNFVLKFLKKYVKMPTLKDSEWTEVEETKEVIDTNQSSLNDCMKDFASNYQHTAQMVYDLMPLFTALGDDSYIDTYPEGKQMLANYYRMHERTLIDLVKRAIVQRICTHLPTSNKSTYYEQSAGRVRIRRMKANEFKLQNRYETASEACTVFSQFMQSNVFKNPEKWKTNHTRPFTVTLVNEGACDCGGPMRDTISNLCNEIMSDVLPLLKPTGNNLARVEPQMDSYQLNSASTEPYKLKKFTFMGYFLGWSLRNMGGLPIDMPIAFWQRICKGSKGYVYTLDDLTEFDRFKAEMLRQITQHARELASDEEFQAIYDGYTFEASFGHESNSEVIVELCPGGSQKALTRANADEFVKLFLEKFTEQDAVQFEHVWSAIQDCVGERMLANINGKIAASRTCSKAEITTKALKSVTRMHKGSDDDTKQWYKWFWEIFEEMSKKERQLFLKFMSGNSRINQGSHYGISKGYTKDSFPNATTCSNEISLPLYSSKELMQQRLLGAILMCGDIDGDGGASEYGAESDASDDEYGNEDRNANEDGDDSDGASINSVRLRLMHFPVYKISSKTKKKKKDGDDDEESCGDKEKIVKDKYALEALGEDDEANAVDVAFEELDVAKYKI